MALTYQQIKNSKPAKKPTRLYDEKGLYLLISPNGGKGWRFKYRFEGKEKLLSLGVYPETDLKTAREKRDEARKLLSNGVDPSAARKAHKAATRAATTNGFEVVAREWFAKFSQSWVESHSEKIIRRLEREVFPFLGHRPVSEINAVELLSVIRRIEERGTIETAHRTLQSCGQVFRYAIATGRADRDPTADLRGALTPVKGRNFAAITDPKKIGELMRSIEGYQGSFIVKEALRLAPLLFVRPGELRKAEWSEIDLEKAEWNIPADKMKTRQAHLVPLSRQAIEILRELFPLTGRGKYLFPCARSIHRPMSNNAILAALRGMGYAKEEMTGHGFRAMARTLLDEELKFRPEVIEQQLAHNVKDPLGRAYNRTQHLEERREMMQRWADYLGQLKRGGEVIALRGLNQVS